MSELDEKAALDVIADAAAKTVAKQPPKPVREKAAGKIRCDHNLNILRSCQACGACFLCLAFGKTGEAGIWRQWAWFCSRECAS